MARITTREDGLYLEGRRLEESHRGTPLEVKTDGTWTRRTAYVSKADDGWSCVIADAKFFADLAPGESVPQTQNALDCEVRWPEENTDQ